MNPFKLEVLEITKPNRSGKTLSDIFILRQPMQRETELNFILCWLSSKWRNIIVQTFLTSCVKRWNIWNILFFFLDSSTETDVHISTEKLDKKYSFCLFLSSPWLSPFFVRLCTFFLHLLLIRSYLVGLYLFFPDLLYQDV